MLCVSSGELMSTIQHPRKMWLETACSQFGGRCRLWCHHCSSPLPSSSGCHMSASLPPAGEGPTRNQLALLWYSFNPLYCEWARLPVRAFHGKVCCCDSFFFPLPPCQSTVGLLSHVTSLRLSSGHSDPVLTPRIYDAACTSLTSPHLLVAAASIWATSPLGVEVRCIFMTPSPEQVSVPKSFIFLFAFYIFSYFL